MGTQLSDRDFSAAFEKKVRKFIRVRRAFEKGERVLAKGKVNKFLIERILEKFPIKIVSKSDGKKADKVFVDWTMDDELCSFLGMMMKGEKRQKPEGKSLLIMMSDDDVARFASIHRINFTPAEKDKELLSLVKQMQRQYQGSDTTLLRNIERWDKATKNK